MRYDLSDELSRRSFTARVKRFLDKGSYVELTDKSRRSLSQNSYLHAILTVLALETGATVETVKREIYKKRLNPDLYLVKKIDPVLGLYETYRSSRELTTEEMNLSIQRYKQFCAENGIYVPEPGDTELLRQIEIEEAKFQQFL